MTSIETLATFFGWCIVINFGALLLIVLVFGLFHDIFATLSAKVFGITREEAAVTFFTRGSAVSIRADGPEHRSLYRPEDHVLIRAPTPRAVVGPAA